jgi:HMG (high mobility group) box
VQVHTWHKSVACVIDSWNQLFAMSSEHLDESEEDDLSLNDISVGSQGKKGKKNKKKRDGSKMRKAPQAPKRGKSNYICFMMAKRPEIKETLGNNATAAEIVKTAAHMWRSLTAEERAHWDNVAEQDKQRYMVEKAAYTGPWHVSSKRSKKDPSAPKKPMTAFLQFSQERRRQVQEANPSKKNAEVSKLLGEMWKAASDDEKRPHVEKGKEDVEKHREAMADWRRDNDFKLAQEQKTYLSKISTTSSVALDVTSIIQNAENAAKSGIEQLTPSMSPKCSEAEIEHHAPSMSPKSSATNIKRAASPLADVSKASGCTIS